MVANEKLLLMMNKALAELVKAVSQHPDQSIDLARRLEALSQSVDWRRREFKVERLKQEAGKQLDALSSADVKMREIENTSAQKLFLALAENVRTTSGPEFLMKLIWEICGQPLAGAAVGPSPNSAIPSVEIENGPTSLGREHAPNLVRTLGSGYDFVVKESEVSELLASQLKIPSVSVTEFEHDRGNGKDQLLAWRCCPVAEIDLWKSEKDEYVQANAKLLEEIQLERKARGETCSPEREVEAAFHLQRLSALESYVDDLHRGMGMFLGKALKLITPPHLEVPPESTFGLLTFDKLLSGIEKLWTSVSKSSNISQIFRMTLPKSSRQIFGIWPVSSLYLQLASSHYPEKGKML
jgi:hypothetical protein